LERKRNENELNSIYNKKQEETELKLGHIFCLLVLTFGVGTD
jgi:hypothetical protein